VSKVRPARRWPAVILTGLVVGVWAFLMLLARPPSPELMAITGLSARGLELEGGVRWTARAPAGQGATVEPILAARAAAYGSNSQVSRDGDLLTVEIVGVGERLDEARSALLARKGLALYRVLDEDEQSAAALMSFADGDPAAHELQVEQRPETWQGQEGDQHVASFLAAPSCEALTAYLDGLRTRAPERLPGAGLRLLLEPLPARPDSETPGSCRTYLVRDAALLDQRHVAASQLIIDDATARPLVHVTLTDEGRRLFAELTREATGHKVAIVVDQRVASAPVVMEPITGGQLTITPGGGDPRTVQADAQALVSVLASPALPVELALEGETVIGASQVAATPARVLAARLLWALAAGLLAMLLVGPVLARFRLAPALPPLHGHRWARDWGGRLLITAFAITAAVLATRLDLPGVDGQMLRALAQGADPGRHVGALALGLAPMFFAFVLVELAALIVPAWRRRRRDQARRRPFTLAAILLGVVLAVAQGWALTVWMEHLDVVDAPGALSRWTIVLSLVGGTLLLVVLASLIERRGFGPGWPVIALAVELVDVVAAIRDPAGPVGVELAGQVATLACTAWLAIGLARVRLAAAPAPVRLPAGGILPVAWFPLLGLVVVAFALPGDLLETWREADGWFATRPLVLVAGVAALGLLVHALMHGRRPRLVASTVLGTLGLVVLVLVDLAGGGRGMPLFAALAGATLADFLGDLWARRHALTELAVFQDVQAAEAVAARLGAAGIAASLTAGHYRALARPFGPYAPVRLRVPTDRLEQARAVLVAP
jgi:hypothetical protein